MSEKRSKHDTLRQRYREDVLKLSSVFPNYSLEELFNKYKNAGHSVERALEILIEENTLVDEKNTLIDEETTPIDSEYSDEEIIEVDIEETFEQEKKVEKSTIKDNKCIWKVLTQTELLEEQYRDVEKVQQILQLNDPDDTHTVLKQYRWNSEKLINDYVTLGREELLKKSGILNNNINRVSSLSCMACMEDECIDMITHTPCGHSFCKNCWKTYIITKVLDGFLEQNRIYCMSYQCKAILGQKFISLLIDNQSTMKDIDEKYTRNRIEAYIDEHHAIKYCPSIPSCGLAIRLLSNDSANMSQVKCNCGYKFCFGCLGPWHQPATCDMIKKWNMKVQGDNANLVWLSDNTKQCPHCNYPIEKNGGCDHMTCFKCGQRFNWSYVKPSTYITRNHSSIQSIIDLNPQAIDAFFRATIRSSHHRNFLNNEQMILHNKLLDISTRLDSDQDLSWLQKALSKSSKMRRFIINCYCYAYYTFEMEQLYLDLIEKNKNFMKKENIEQKIHVNKKVKERNIKERQIARKAVDMYFNMFNHQLELLESTIERIMLIFTAIEDRFIKSEYDIKNEKSIPEQVQFLTQQRSHMNIQFNALRKQQDALLEVITKRDMQEYESQMRNI